ncbi:alpha/beta hydrolase [Williamsia sp. CHRR-6]|uniref:alpha/beta hydrolase n=1 Tax=Williamsia sp. CHRR-6 TaxID=2835871 RepID=UPI001BDA49BF|nr:alpha/beta hydrolase [Williamsia sp. CHRR-6]MBT0567960.1 alpha/beta hydrolase [Williamsia sp. CHRR-6]
MPRNRLLTAACAAGLLLITAGCAVGPDTGPSLVLDGGGGGGAGPSSRTPPPPPEFTAPTSDLDWGRCDASQSAAAYGLPAPAADVVVDCATFRSSVAPGTSGGDGITIAAVRVRLSSTPAAASPVVVTAGSDLPSAIPALMTAIGPARQILADHPFVAVDRRGIGASSAIDCLTASERAVVATNGAGTGAAADPGTRQQLIQRTAAEAADGCTDTLTPHQLDYTAANAAADLERLRVQWKVSRIAVLGVGSGTDVALAYAGLYRNRLARIVLDTPAPYLVSARTRAQQITSGLDTAFARFATDCRAVNCSLGPDPTAAVIGLIGRAASGGLPGLSDTDVVRVMATALAVSTGERAATVRGLADQLSAAIAGDTAALRATATRARELRDADGQLVSRCNDIAQPVGQNEISGLVASWRSQYPVTGVTQALSLARCTGWAAGPAMPRPAGFDVPVLIVTNAYDTVVGGSGSGALTPLLAAVRATSATVSYDGPGFSTVAHSECVGGIVERYLTGATVPDSGACPS